MPAYRDMLAAGYVFRDFDRLAACVDDLDDLDDLETDDLAAPVDAVIV